MEIEIRPLLSGLITSVALRAAGPRVLVNRSISAVGRAAPAFPKLITKVVTLKVRFTSGSGPTGLPLRSKSWIV